VNDKGALLRLLLLGAQAPTILYTILYMDCRDTEQPKQKTNKKLNVQRRVSVVPFLLEQ